MGKSIKEVNDDLERSYNGKMSLDPSLSRSLVSFQSNKSRAAYRWYKFKEAFSAGLVELLLRRYGAQGPLLDPFAGSGTALFASSSLGLDAEGIELLPLGQAIVEARWIADGIDPDGVRALSRWAEGSPREASGEARPLDELRITKGAYPGETAKEMGRFLALAKGEDPNVFTLLRFALLCILETISFTRKDGQYLRWDHRSPRQRRGKAFDKGLIPSFGEAMRAKLREMVADMGADPSPSPTKPGKMTLHHGSCLEVLPRLPAASFGCVLTSPPYCNRYDYTRTYALELALLGVGDEELGRLRQAMLSCTVENRAKALLEINSGWKAALDAAEGQELLQAVLLRLDEQKKKGLLNNASIPRMVRGYFQEMSCVIFECARVLRGGGRLIMVNDNVRYAGTAISVDLVLSDVASRLGFEVEAILVLPVGKGNSSQQMGIHGRKPLRKCIYIWRKC